jgi:oligopeptide/dipeptide ABC transporter ATP-binding protein
MNTLLKVENLKKYFPVNKGILGRNPEWVRAVNGVSFDISPGETFGLVGESGSGKSTIGRCILRLLDVTEGRIVFDGRDITHLNRKAMRPFRKDIQIIFQDPYSSLNPRMPVKDLIGTGLRAAGKMNARERSERIREIMEQVGLRPEHYSRYPHEFSGGQRQRIGIGRAMAPNPRLIIADEPLSALDVSIQAQIINLMEKLREDFNLSYLFISHDLSVVEHISDRIAVMYLGTVLELGSKEDVYDQPKHPYTKALLSSVPLPQIRRNTSRIILEGDIPSPLQPPSGCVFHTRCYTSLKICSEIEPVWKDLGGGHFTACHLY